MAVSPVRPRLKDIAAATGFSTNTVSLALRKSPLVTEETRRIIAHAAKELRYRPNEIAKSLVQRQTRSIGLVLTNIVNPILTQTAEAVEIALSRRGYALLLATSNNLLEQETRALEAFSGRQVDGVLIYPANHSELDHIVALRQLGVPVVLLASEGHAGIDAVSFRDRQGGYMATRHLLELGHRRIGVIDGGPLIGSGEKSDGYRQALAEYGIAFDPELLRLIPGYAPGTGYRGTEELMALPAPPTAVFGSNDTLAVGVLDWCVRHGFEVPRDISIVGFDNIDLSAYFSTPLTTVAYDPQAMARMAVERVLSLIEDDEGAVETSLRVIEPRMVIRKSTAPPAGR
jgi:LacI family transcriptional regulator, galactose operon repressor